ncbi:MAG: Gfo/Idh/MocA family oxidoreductase [Candidatus Poribacteria bacterium]|nr:Gfo/Idh/MocA family oxidoreductase [Candidatus Poribacteria bacterium]
MTASTTAKYRVGIIGCGRAGTTRARGFDLHPLCEVVAIADTDPENLELGCQRFNAPGYSTYEEMFRNEQIDIAMPVLPVRPNADAVVASAEAGVKAIFCEKPLTASLEDADRMVEACRTRGVHLAAGVVVSSHPDYQKAYELVAAGEIGEVQRINLYEGNSQGGCHGLNLARKFADKASVDWVVGWVDGDPFSDYEEPYNEGDSGFGNVGGYIRFSNGIECFSNFKDIGWKGIEVIGSHGVLYNWNNTALGLHLLKAANGAAQRGPVDLREVSGLFQEYNADERGYDDEGWRYPGDTMMGIVQAIVDSLERGDPLKVTTGDDLRHALEIAIGLRESHRRGHTAVKFPIEDRSLVMYPQKSRWHYKKDLWGRERYMEQMRQQKR